MLVLRTIWCYNAKDRAGTGQKLPVSLLPVQSQSHCALVAQARHLLCWASPANLVLNCVLQNNSPLMLAGFKKWEAKELWLWKSQLASLGKDPRNSWKFFSHAPLDLQLAIDSDLKEAEAGQGATVPVKKVGFEQWGIWPWTRIRNQLLGKCRGMAGWWGRTTELADRPGWSSATETGDRCREKTFVITRIRYTSLLKELNWAQKTLLGCWWGEVTASTPFTGPSPTWRASPGFPPSTGARHGGVHDIHRTCFGDPDGLPRPFQSSPFSQSAKGGSH